MLFNKNSESIFVGNMGHFPSTGPETPWNTDIQRVLYWSETNFAKATK